MASFQEVTIWALKNRVTAPIIAFWPKPLPGNSVVSSDNYAGGVLGRNFSKTGARKIIMISGMKLQLSNRLASCGFASVLPESMIINVSSDFSLFAKEMEIKQILTHHKPDAIFASDDLTILIMKVARELEFRFLRIWKWLVDGTQFIETYTPERQPSNNPSKTLLFSWWIFTPKIEGKKVTTTGYFLPISLHSGKSVKTTPTVLLL